jgi:hypothetical protein
MIAPISGLRITGLGSIGVIGCAALLVAAHTTVAAAQAIPRLDVTTSCRAQAKGLLGLAQDEKVCINGEAGAREQIAKEWGTFSTGDRTGCVALTTTGSGGTYTELLTCLEMKRDARQLTKEAEADAKKKK